MGQSKYLFIGGPWNGQWHPVMPYAAIKVPTFKRSDLIGYDLDEIHIYRQRIIEVPGAWVVPIVVYVADPVRTILRGTPMPGWVQGERPEAWSIDPDAPVWLDEAARDLHDAIKERGYRP